MKLPKSYYNLVSFIGTVIVVLSLFLIIFVAIIGYLYKDTSSYLGLYSYIIIPVFLLIGLIIIPVGMYIEFKRRKKHEREYIKMGWPIIDLNVGKYRNAIAIFGFGTITLLILSSIGSYEAFHYTESNEFCGTLCHEVMEPEHIAYQNSPHARVACVDCHVGTGATWYMRSKLSGLRQVYAVLTDNFSRPIETPIHDLRPAQETCEECHWPEKFYARQLRQTKYYLTDSLNTQWNLSLQMKIGPEHSAMGLSEGIHWHINPKVKIEYVSLRDRRENIPWVKYTNLETGDVTVFENEEEALSDKKMAEAEIREMDCMDCHNRPSHHYYTPMEFIDHALTAGNIPDDLPYIKKIAMDLFIDPYDNKDTAIHTIRNYTKQYYTENLPEVLDAREDDIDNAIESIINEFSQNIFPHMGVSWDVYESHIGHKTYNGCFRCHDDKHKSENGSVISMDCNLCHSIVSQGNPGSEQFANVNDALDFIHPKKLKEGWEEDVCSECHRYLY
ncbi:MAG: NapC/NirT family cytochrome c [Cyclobacteriaceae bacterium]|nr:NapC/NirT family cytochrome c [Cyclobacteriaceae bacterium]